MSPGPVAEERAITLNWTIIVPLKSLPTAKSRLAPVSADPQSHADLVEAIRADTLAVAAAVGRVLLVLDQPAPTTTQLDWPVVVQVGAGLNAAVREAAQFARIHWPDDAIAALVGDLPALRATELEATLAAAVTHPRGFVSDAAATGTTLLTALPGVSLEPEFGLDSATRHARIAHSLPAGPGLRLDVDTDADLEQARLLGVGPATKLVRNW
jgi:2-phospho-L-lactate guanylyltransferase